MKAVAFVSSLVALAILLAANARYVYSDALHELPPLTAGHIADPRFAGSTFRFDGLVSDVRTLPSGMVIIKLQNHEEDLHLDASLFPSLGCLPVKPASGETVRVTGNLGMYQGRPQIKPLSAAHIKVLSSGAAAIPLADALSTERVGETLRVGPLTAVAVEPFTSRRGREHVRLTLADPQAAAGARDTAQGVMFQGDRTACEVSLLRSGAPVVVTAEINLYEGRPSLTVRRVLAATSR